MKTFKFLSLFAIIMLVFTSAFAVETTEVFSTGGLVGWDTVGMGTVLDTADGLTYAFKDLAVITTPANTNDFGLDGATWGWDAVRMNASVGNTQPAAGAYIGVRYQAPTGKVIVGVNIPKIYNAVSPYMHVRIVDADGVVAAEMTPTETLSLNSLEATMLTTSAVEIRWVNSHSWPINLWGENNGVIFNTVEVTLDDAVYNPIIYDNPTKPTTWYGYYHAYSDVTNWGDAFPDVGSFTNLNYVFPSVGAIDSAKANNSYMLVDVMWHLFQSNGSGGYELRSDWEASIEGLKLIFAGNEEYIGAITPIDEPYHRSVSQSELESAIAALKAAFPGVAIYVNFAHPQVLSLTSATLPAGTDWLAFDLYDSYDDSGQPVPIADIQMLVNHLKSIKSVDQKLFLVPPSALNLVATYTDQLLADTINAFYGLMQSDAEIIGMMVFPSDGCRQVVFDDAGSTIPIALAAQQAIGAEIAGDVCGDIWNGFYEFDYNRDCRVDLIDFAEYALLWMPSN